MARSDLQRFVALLRGVNVGGKRPVAMAELRRVLTAAGYEGVRTYLQSGNVVFDAHGGDPRAHAATIAAILRDDLGQEVEVHVVACADVRRIATENPFSAQATADDRSVHVLFLFAPVAPAGFEALQLPATAGEQAVLGDGVIYLHLPHGYGRSKLTNVFFERKLATPMTARNWRTVVALQGLCSAEE